MICILDLCHFGFYISFEDSFRDVLSRVQKNPKFQLITLQIRMQTTPQPRFANATFLPPSWISNSSKTNFQFVFLRSKTPGYQIELNLTVRNPQVLISATILLLPSWISYYLKINFRFAFLRKKTPSFKISCKSVQNQPQSPDIRPPYCSRHLGFQIFQKIVSDLFFSGQETSPYQVSWKLDVKLPETPIFGGKRPPFWNGDR